MKCESCGRCQGVKNANGTYEIKCLENGEFDLHSDYEETFHCGDYEERIEEEPPKDNVMIILKCGRDFVLYDKDITCMADLDRLIIEDAWDAWVKFGNFTFNRDEIVCYGYIGG